MGQAPAIAWCGFLGAWLLVAGPIYQAAIELGDEEFERSDLEQALHQVPDQPLHFSETAAAWMFVASGAFLIAVKETWELHEAYEWPAAVFYALVVVMIIACTANTALRIRRRRDTLAQAQPPSS